MNLELLATLAPLTFVLCLCVATIAGIVKGAVGFAQPLILVSGLSSLTDPKLAVAAIIIPVMLSNVIQTFRNGIAPAVAATKEYWRYLLVIVIAIFIAAQFVPSIPTHIFYIVLGIPVVLLSSIQLAGLTFDIPPHRRALAEWSLGTMSGILGGLAGTWGPTTVLYLLATQTPKAKQMLVQGVVYGLGSVSFLFAHLQSGILTGASLSFSALLLVPSMIGMWFGMRIQDRLDQQLFRKVTLIVLVIVGLNLLRKGFFT